MYLLVNVLIKLSML